MGLVYGDILLMILDFHLTSFIVNSQEFGIYTLQKKKKKRVWYI